MISDEEITPRPGRRSPKAIGAIAFLQKLGGLFLATVAIASLCVGAVAWFLNVQTAPAAAKAHEEIRSEFRGADSKIVEHASGVEGQLREVGRDVKTIKCLLTKAKQRERDACVLGDR